MKLINTDGMAFIRPGSEWFWTAVSGLVLAVTFLAIYRQLSVQASASAREQLDAFDEEWGSERMIRYRLDVLLYLRDGSKPRADIGIQSAKQIANFWERVGALGRSKHLDPELLWASRATMPPSGGSGCHRLSGRSGPTSAHPRPMRTSSGSPESWRS